MASTSTPTPKTNRIGLSVMEYKGGKTTLCAGCGHNAISERITRLRSIAHIHGLPLDARSVTDEIMMMEGK